MGCCVWPLAECNMFAFRSRCSVYQRFSPFHRQAVFIVWLQHIYSTWWARGCFHFLAVMSNAVNTGVRVFVWTCFLPSLGVSWFWFAFLYWLVLMSVVRELISHLCISFGKMSTQILWSLKKLGCLFIEDFFMYFKYELFIRYMTCKYFLSYCGLSFHLLVIIIMKGFDFYKI